MNKKELERFKIEGQYEAQSALFRDASTRIQKAILSIGYMIMILIILMTNIIYNRPVTWVSFVNIGAAIASFFELIGAIGILIEYKKIYKNSFNEAVSLLKKLERHAS